MYNLIDPLSGTSAKKTVSRFCIPNDKIHFFSYFVSQNHALIYFHLK